MDYKIGDMIRIYDSCAHLGELCGKVGKIVGDLIVDSDGYDYFIGYPVEFVNDKTGEKHIENISPEIFDVIELEN